MNWQDIEVLQSEEGESNGGVGDVDRWNGGRGMGVERGDGEVLQFIGDPARANVNAAIGGFAEDEVREELSGGLAVDVGSEVLWWLGDEVAEGFSEMLADRGGGGQGLDDRGIGIVVDDLLEIGFVSTEVEFVGGHRRWERLVKAIELGWSLMVVGFFFLNLTFFFCRASSFSRMASPYFPARI